MRSTTLFTVLSSALLASACTITVTVGGELGPSSTATSTSSTTTTETSTITVYPSSTSSEAGELAASSLNSTLSTSKAGGGLTSLVPTGAPALNTSQVGGIWNTTASAVETSASLATPETSATIVAGVSTSVGKTAAAPTTSLTAGAGRVELMGGLLVGVVGIVAAFL